MGTTELKQAINQFIWEHGPGEMTLEQADAVAVTLLGVFESCSPKPTRKEFLVE